MTRPVLYIAGPYTAGDNDLAWPLVPHLSHMWHLISPRPYADWIALDFALLERCDGLIRLPGVSTGADGVLSTLDGDTIGPCPECAP